MQSIYPALQIGIIQMQIGNLNNIDNDRMRMVQYLPYAIFHQTYICTLFTLANISDKTDFRDYVFMLPIFISCSTILFHWIFGI